jgi:hypothetical protein
METSNLPRLPFGRSLRRSSTVRNEKARHLV